MSRKKPEVEEDELALFREAMRDVRPLQAPERVEHRRRPKPVPRFRLADESNALLESLREDPFRSELETGEELLYLRAGENPRLLRRLRRGEVPIAAGLASPSASSSPRRSASAGSACGSSTARDCVPDRMARC